MGIYTDQTRDQSAVDHVDVLGRRWGVFNKPGTAMFVVKGYRLENGQKLIDERYNVPIECTGDWTKREWAEASIKIYKERLEKETEQAVKRSESKERNQKREELNAASTS